MGRVFEALQRNIHNGTHEPAIAEFDVAPDIPKSVDLDEVNLDEIDLDRTSPLAVAPIPQDRLIILDGQRSLGAEKIRILGARLRQLQDQRLIKKLLVTSTVKDEGKTVLSINVATSLAKTQQRVLLIDGDCHQTSSSRLLGANGSPGLTDWWRSEDAVQNYLVRVNGLPLWFLPAGKSVEQPLEMLQSSRFAKQINKLSSSFDWIIIDSPPSAPLADASVWGTMADGILVVTRQGRTPKRLLKKTLNALDAKKVLGIVLNDCSDPDQRHYNQYYNLPTTN
jgi:capsular exopolysaccharide synthesis family protein